MNQMIFENLRRDPKITTTQIPHRPHHANQITTEDSPHRLPKGGNRVNILQGRGAKALEEDVPEVAPASSRKGWSRPWSGRGGKRDGADTHHPGQGPRGSDRGVKPSPLPGMRGYEVEEPPRTSLAPGLGPWGAKASDRTGQGRMDAEKASIQVSHLPVGERGEVR
jgi:hypothetical protein